MSDLRNVSSNPQYPGEGYHFPDYADSSYRTASARIFWHLQFWLPGTGSDPESVLQPVF